MNDERAKRRLAAILAADVVGYSRLMQLDEAGTLVALKTRRTEVLQPAVSRHHGRIVKLMGDGVLIEFASAVDAVECAVQLQSAMADANTDTPQDRQIVLRIGINLGDVMVEGTDLYGDGVNIAARLEALADPGSVLISAKVRDEIAGKTKLALEDLGERVLKHIAAPVRTFRISGPAPVASMPNRLAGSQKPSIAVLAFTNMSGDPEQDYFSDGITEDIITELSRFHSFSVIARNSSFSFKGRSVNISEVGRMLGVRYVVEGSVRKMGRRVRITAQLIEAATGAHVWAERYDRDLEEIFEVQDEVTERIVWALTGMVAAAEITRSKQRRVENLDAYDLVLRGQDLLYRNTAKDSAAAIDLIKKASELDPNSGWILSWLALAHSQAGFLEDGGRKFDLAIQAAEQALALGDEEDWTDAVVAYIAGWRRDFQEAERHLSRAMAKNAHAALTIEARIWVLL
jgi:TolB-like protein